MVIVARSILSGDNDCNLSPPVTGYMQSGEFRAEKVFSSDRVEHCVVCRNRNPSPLAITELHAKENTNIDRIKRRQRASIMI